MCNIIRSGISRIRVYNRAVNMWHNARHPRLQTSFQNHTEVIQSIPPVGSISVIPLRAAVVASAYSSGSDLSPPIGKNFAACAPISSIIRTAVSPGDAGRRTLAAANAGGNQHFARRPRRANQRVTRACSPPVAASAPAAKPQPVKVWLTCAG